MLKTGLEVMEMQYHI